MNPHIAPPPNNNSHTGNHPNNSGRSNNGWGRYEDNQNHRNQNSNSCNLSNNRQQSSRNNPRQWQNSQSNANRRPQSQQANQQIDQSYNQQHHRNPSSQSQHQHHPASRNQTQYAVLYTHQKTKKKPTWKDGRLKLSGGRATLYEAHPLPGSGDAPLDSLEVSRAEIDALSRGDCADLESEKYLIQIEGPWRTASSSLSSMPKKTSVGPSARMKRLINTKFQVPQRVMPNFEQQRRMKMEKMNKRRKVLQPGELERMHYGGVNGGYGDGDNGGYNQGNFDSNCGGFEQQHGSYYDNRVRAGNDSNGNNNRRAMNDIQNNQYGDHDNGRINHSSSNGSNTFNQNDRCNDRCGPSYGMSQRNFQNTNQSGALDQGQIQHGNNPNPQNRGGATAFQSNGLDASGFYQEEDEEDEDQAETNQSNRQQEASIGHERLASESYHNSYHLTHQNTSNEANQNNYESNNNDSQGLEPAAYSNQSHTSNNDNKGVSDELLALLGASSAPEQDTSVSNPRFTAPTNESQTGASNSSNQTHIQGGENNNKGSFLTGLPDADDDLDDDEPMAFDFNNQKFDDYDSFGDGLYDDLANDETNPSHEASYEPNEDNQEGTNTSQITSLTLPSPGETSSEDDEEDSLAEE